MSKHISPPGAALSAQTVAAPAAAAILNESQLAALLGIQPRTCRLWRKFRGLPHIRITAKEIRYRMADVDAWLQSRTVRQGSN